MHDVDMFVSILDVLDVDGKMTHIDSILKVKEADDKGVVVFKKLMAGYMQTSIG